MIHEKTYQSLSLRLHYAPELYHSCVELLILMICGFGLQLTDNYDDIFHARQRREAYNMIEGTFHRRALLLATC